MENQQQRLSWTVALFRKFAHYYGAQKMAGIWGDLLPADLESEWEPELRKFTGATIGQALEAIKQQSKEWPPTLPEFLTVCRQYNRPEHRLALPEPFPDKEIARRGLAKLREVMK